MVRCAAREDLPELLSLLSQLSLETMRPPEELSATFAEMLASRTRLILVACIDDALVGTLDLSLMANLTHAGRPWADIENVVIDERHRRRGIASALMDVAVELAQAAGCYKLQLISGVHRQDAHALYERYGFDLPVRGFRRYLEA
jgi:ribosomal protein S18 acetylase RimI-like enzyme